MTDNVVNGKVEDVLSSIKRLVSEEGRKIPDIQSSLARRPGRLVLTDALRVSEASNTQDEPETESSSDQVADASVKPMLLRASDISQESSPAAEQKDEPAKNNPVDSLSAKIEALEAAIAKTEDQWEPDGESEDAYSGTTTQPLEWSDEPEAAPENNPEATEEAEEPVLSETKATFIRDPQATSRTAAPASAPRDVETLDQEALRALIAKVVREELQGVLGERITRNVRKMVRREIQKALAEYKVE